MPAPDTRRDEEAGLHIRRAGSLNVPGYRSFQVPLYEYTYPSDSPCMSILRYVFKTRSDLRFSSLISVKWFRSDAAGSIIPSFWCLMFVQGTKEGGANSRFFLC